MEQATAARSTPVLNEGEILRGITLHEGRAAHLIQLPDEFRGTHAEAVAWAKEKGGELPSRIDGIVLFDNARNDFKHDDYYWLAPQYEHGAAYAWGQGFGGGYQYCWHKGSSYRAVAVRRIPIQ